MSFELNITDKKNSISVKKNEDKKEIIANYSDKLDAEKAFSNISSAMFAGSAEIKEKKPFKSMLFLFLIIVASSLYIMSKDSVNLPAGISNIGQASNNTNTNQNVNPTNRSIAPAVRSGVPIDASDMFK